MSIVLGHERQIEYLDKILERGGFAHAYLFYGPEHVGKFSVALALAKTLLCENGNISIRNNGDHCRTCTLIDKNSNANVLILDTNHTLTSKKQKRNDIPIDDIRELRRLLSLSAAAFQKRIVILNDAEKLSREAADAILKTLEEPGQGVVFIFVTPHKDLLPQTIVSRMQEIRFDFVPRSTLEDFLEKRVNPRGTSASRMTDGDVTSPSAVFDLTTDQFYQDFNLPQSAVFDEAKKTGKNRLSSNDVKIKKSLEEILFFTGGRPGVLMDILNGSDNIKREIYVADVFGNKSARLLTGYYSQVNRPSDQASPLAEGSPKVTEKSRDEATFYHPEVFRISEKISSDEELGSRALLYILRSLERGLYEDTDNSVHTASLIKKILSISEILRTTNVNPRLAWDVMLLEFFKERGIYTKLV